MFSRLILQMTLLMMPYQCQIIYKETASLNERIVRLESETKKSEAETASLNERIVRLESEMKKSEADTASLKDKIVKLESELQRNLKGRGCFSGIESFCSGTEDGLPVNTTVNVNFPMEFDNEPIISLGIVYLDTSWDTNVRVSTKASNLTKTGFTLSLKTWSDTRLFCFRSSWMACTKFK